MAVLLYCAQGMIWRGLVDEVLLAYSTPSPIRCTQHTLTILLLTPSARRCTTRRLSVQQISTNRLNDVRRLLLKCLSKGRLNRRTDGRDPLKPIARIAEMLNRSRDLQVAAAFSGPTEGAGTRDPFLRRLIFGTVDHRSVCQTDCTRSTSQGVGC